MSDGQKETVSINIFKKQPFVNNFRIETKDGKLLVAELAGLVVKSCENFCHVWVFEGIWVIRAKPPFLHTLDVPIKMFAHILAKLKQQTLGRTNHIHCFQTQ